jgi:hypothetical protein
MRYFMPPRGIESTDDESHPRTAAAMPEPLRAAEMAAMLRNEIFDVEDAAAFLGVTRATIWQQAAHNRIAYVQLRTTSTSR